MNADAFAALAEPTRLRILAELRGKKRSVGELVVTLGLAQPAVSKHLRILRESGFVTRETSAQRRIYRIELARFRGIDAWLDPYRKLWKKHLDALERHLDEQETP